jgi:hypothetical protein
MCPELNDLRADFLYVRTVRHLIEWCDKALFSERWEHPPFVTMTDDGFAREALRRNWITLVEQGSGILSARITEKGIRKAIQCAKHQAGIVDHTEV